MAADWLAVCDKQLDGWGLHLSLTVCQVLACPWDGEMAGGGGMGRCVVMRESLLAGCTQSEAESNQSLRMMLLRAAAGSATKFGREHSDRVPRLQHWNLEELGSLGDPCPSGPSLVGPGYHNSLLHQLVSYGLAHSYLLAHPSSY